MKRRILIVDDDSRITELLQEFVTEIGYEAKCLNDSRRVLETVLDWKPDMVTLDLEMPHMDGMEVLKELRGNPDAKNVPIMIISVLAHEAGIEKASVQGLFAKPIKFTRLFEQIHNVLRPAA